MNPNSRQSTSSNRNLRPANALGSAGEGATSDRSDLPLLFDTSYHHDTSNPGNPPMAIARAGGHGGSIYVYADEPLDIVGGSPRRVRESLTSYLLPFSRNPNLPVLAPGRDPDPLTPPSSYTPNVQISNHRIPFSRPAIAQSYPLTPTSSSSSPDDISQSLAFPAPAVPAAYSPIPLIGSLFPYHASQITPISTLLEVVTPPDHILTGFIADHQVHGRTVYVHLPPPHIDSHRPEALSANFSEVLRPHDPSRSPRTDAGGALGALDIRESLTALLDLSCDSLEANNLVLALDRDDRELEGLGDLLHSLMFAGGQVVKPGMLQEGWEWDPQRWVLVGIEL